MSRWFNRVWKLALEEYAPGDIDNAAEADLVRKTHQVIRKVNLDLDKLQFNTMLAALMEFTNYMAPVKESGKVSAEVWTRAVECLVLLLAPTAPHLAEELWQLMGNPYSVHNQSFPIWDEALTAEPEITLVVQINGKVRARFQVPASITECQATDLALSNERVKEFTASKTVKTVVYVPGKLVNIVVI